MTRNERIQKLARTIKKYRGTCNQEPRGSKHFKWIYPPDLGMRKHILNHLAELDMELIGAMDKIDKFKTQTEMGEWLKTLEKPTKNKKELIINEAYL